MNVPEYLWYGEELVKLNDLLTKVFHQENNDDLKILNIKKFFLQGSTPNGTSKQFIYGSTE